MASPDPQIRDGWAYAELSGGIRSGRFTNSFDVIRASAVNHLNSPDVQARSFAPLVLAWLVLAGDRDEAAFEQVRRWYLTEPDTRGYDPDLGWLHVVAHGADYLAECVKTGIASSSEVVETLARRTTFDGVAWRDQEDARVAAAVLAALAQDAGSASVWTEHLERALDAFEAAERPARPPDWMHNVYTTCTALYVALSEQPMDGTETLTVDGAPAITHALAQLISRITPWLLLPRGCLVSGDGDEGVSY